MKLICDKPASPAVIALGANLPFGYMFPAEILRAALAALEVEGITISGLSRFWRTPCFPAGAGPDYVNAVALVHGHVLQEPEKFLSILHRIEADHGRERQSRWAGRTLDLDLIALGDSVLPDGATQDAWRDLPPGQQVSRAPDRLILPHPRLQDRAFVLVPMAEVAPDWIHPRLGLSTREMLARLPEADRAAVTPL
ncbi:2-amino-4-hydroxy-6-hydroxymethyldihydropteridine diphosphokinase [Pseudogemmobacter humi]|nr:2-amino-4-hydroxy-6-hydroxymethyldihydropteridine diphosphokinase [Pseudogemmobacter humi]